MGYESRNTNLLYVSVDLTVHNIECQSQHFDLIDQQKRPINLFPLLCANRKQRIVHLQGASNINCMQHCCFYI